MIRNCAVCGKPIDAQRPTKRFCGPTCRQRASRGALGHNSSPQTKTRKISIDPDATSPNEAEINSLVRATRAELEAAGVLDTMLGQQALSIATEMSGFGTAGGMAALSKELSRVMAEALRAAVSLQVDSVDELSVRRDAKLAG